MEIIPKLTFLKPGDKLPVYQTEITQELINEYAEVSGDYNPIHIDISFAAKTPFKGTIAHGMLTLGMISQYMTQLFGEDWVTGGKMKARFKAPAKPGDLITIEGLVKNITSNNGKLDVSFSINCQNQKGENLILTEAFLSKKDIEPI